MFQIHDLIGIVLGSLGVLLNIRSVIILSTGIAIGKKHYAGIICSELQAIFDLLTCIIYLFTCVELKLSPFPSVNPTNKCGLISGRALLWVFFSCRISLNVFQGAYYFKKLVLPDYKCSGISKIHLAMGVLTYVLQAVLAGIVHGMQARHTSGYDVCEDSAFLEDKYLSFIGFMKLGVLVHLVTFYVFTVISVRYFYKEITSGLRDSGRTVDRVAYSEFQKFYYLDCTIFCTLLFPHMSGLFLYHFTNGFDFAIDSQSYRITLYIAILYPVLHPWFAKHTSRAFSHPFGMREGKKSTMLPEEEKEALPAEEGEEVAGKEKGSAAKGEKKKKKKKRPA